MKEIENYQVAWYDMERDGYCFEEDFHDSNDFHSTGIACSYVMFPEEEKEDLSDKRRVFINCKDGTSYELVAKKVDSSKCSTYCGDKQ